MILRVFVRFLPPLHPFATPGNPGVVRLLPWTIMSALQYHLPTLAHDVDRL
jgi:hypothetical protein